MEAATESNRRAYERMPVDSVAWISWKDADGVSRKVRGRCLDVSRGGMRLQAPVSVPAGSLITIGVPSKEWETSAEVRHCAPVGRMFQLGAKFVA